MPSWIFVTVTPGLSLHYGNVGLYHRKLGILSNSSVEQMVESISQLPPNYQWGGFYDVKALPSPVEVAQRFGNPESGRLYHTVEDVFFRWLDLWNLAEEAGAASASN